MENKEVQTMFVISGFIMIGSAICFFIENWELAKICGFFGLGLFVAGSINE